MELRLKKRIVGFSLLVALGLIVIPLFFGHSVTTDELQLSSRVPNPPANPSNFSMNVPEKQATVPAIARSSSADANSNSPVVFEQTASTTADMNPPNNAPQPAAAPATVDPAAISAAQSAAVAPAVTPHSAPTNNVTTTIHADTTPAPVPETTAEMVSTTPTTTTHKSSSKPAKTKSTSSTNVAATSTHKTKVPKAAPPAQAWSVQLGVFSDKVNAENLMKKLQLEGFSAYKTTNGGQTRVLVGPELRLADANNLAAKLKKSGYKGIVVKANI